ncbi:MAG: MotA/TolQ/ExbB proton channel family protein [Myxococcales bacterium]|nr:MotA/TolQ/ExbB proton channel family protein [Myxococcales bacterium]
MNLVEWLKRVMVSTGSAWVMWLMIALSVISVAIILERAWFYNSLRDDLARLAKDLQSSLESSIEAAQKRLSQSPSAEAAVVSAGLAVAHRGAAAAEEAMEGAKALQRMKLERRLAYLATLGNNAPFIGLFGTVIGVVMAFDALGQQKMEAGAAQLAPQAVMSSIGEALVATAVGIGVAIPAVAANNVFQRITKATLANTEALSRVLLSHLKGAPMPSAYRGVTAEVATKETKKGEAGKKGKAESKPEPSTKSDEGEDSDEEKG